MAATDKTENSHIEEKVLLRLAAIENLSPPIRILDAFSADGRVWRNVQMRTSKKLRITPIESREVDGRPYLKGDNLKFMKGMDLNKFQVIDLDAYGVPFKQLELLFEKQYKGVVCVTFIQTMLGRLPNDLLQCVGYPPDMVRKCPTLFCRHGMSKVGQYLAQHGIEKITGYFFENRKNYFFFNIA